MTTIIGLSGSLRAAVVQHARSCAPPSRWRRPAPRSSPAPIRGIPLYDGDVETAEGIPPAVAALKEAIVAADGLLLVTPEYNNSIPGVFKNAIDWLSRPERRHPARLRRAAAWGSSASRTAPTARR